jgi:hypothetical protein
MNTKGIQQVTQKLGRSISKNSPTILTGLAVAGLITTTILAVKATPKALLLLEEERDKREEAFNEDDPYPQHTEIEPITPKETIVITWKCYIPAAIMGVVSIVCIIGANSINLKRNAALAGAYSLAETTLKEYQAKVVETIGEKKEQAIKDDIAKDKVARNPVTEAAIIETGNGDTLCFDPYSGRYFRSDIESIRQALSKISYDLLSNMTVTLNEVYYALDLTGTKMGGYLGWRAEDGSIKPNFSSQLTDHVIPCLVLEFDMEPTFIDLN